MIAAKGLNDYAKNKYPTQITPTQYPYGNLVPLGFGFLTPLRLENIDLHIPSFVNDTIIDLRTRLSNMLNEN